MDREQSMKQNLAISLEICCHEAKNIFCKILYIFSHSLPNSAKHSAIAESWWDCLEKSRHFGLPLAHPR